MTPPLRCFPLLALAVAACHTAPQSPADIAARRACRAEVDRVYQAQNRADLSRRDERDSAFAGTYNSGIVTRGMSARFGRDQMVSDCVQANGEPGGSAIDITPAPVFSPLQH
jgi:hypothetical protein